LANVPALMDIDASGTYRMKASLGVIATLLIACLATSPSVQAQQVDLSAVETAPAATAPYIVEIYIDNQSIAITPGGVFDRYWAQSHGGVIKMSDPLAAQKIIDELRRATAHGGRLAERDVSRFLSDVDVVIKVQDVVYFVHDGAMLRQGEDRLRATPECILRIVASWPIVPGKVWGDAGRPKG
jgi:hypothetical protein